MAGARPWVGWLRWAVGLQVALLLAQFELGEWLTIFGDFPANRMSDVSLTAFTSNVVATGPALIAHAILGIAVVSTAALVFLLSLRVRVRWLRTVAGLALLSAAAAGLAGFLFVGQGFAGDRSLYVMGTGFIGVFSATCLSLYLLLTAPPPVAGSAPRAQP